MSKIQIKPDYSGGYYWDSYCKTLEIELRQCIDEGLDISSFESDFKKAIAMPYSKEQADLADEIFEKIINAPIKSDYKYNEPSDLDGIRALRKPFSYNKNELDDALLYNKIKGAWYGRICGCLLGKPLEGIKTGELNSLLKSSGNYPMSRYVLSGDITQEMMDSYSFWLRDKAWADVIDCAPLDDDTTYTVLAQLIIEKFGHNFTPNDVAKVWLQSQPIEKYYTAEKTAFRNFINGYAPPYSAVYQNPYREWIGAQIRGDYFGYITPGDKQAGAEYAFRDASVSHVKNGIYGEMFAAAMLSAAADAQCVCDVIKAGLSEIPCTSRLYEAVNEIVQKYENGASCEECLEIVRSRYDEFVAHDAVHTISNAVIVAIALLYGNGDFGKSICLAVQTGFDTDCNGATVGSVLGMLNGYDSIGEEWTSVFHDKLDTGVLGLGVVKISDLVKKTITHIKR